MSVNITEISLIFSAISLKFQYYFTEILDTARLKLLIMWIEILASENSYL